jgi:hypothetical protein
MDKNQLPKLCDRLNAPTLEKDLYAFSTYFKEACAPGAWIPEKTRDDELSMEMIIIIISSCKVWLKFVIA